MELPDIGSWLLATFDSYGYVLTYFGALLENTAVGMFFPGGSVVLLAGAYSRLGTLQWPVVLLLGWAGMVSGSTIDYWIGRIGLRPLIDRLPSRAGAAKQLARARRFLDRFGPGAVFMGHFMGHVRGFVAMAAGSSHFPYSRYLLFEAPAALFWSLLYTSLGYYLASNLGLAKVVITRLGLAAVIVLLLALIIALAVARRSLLARFSANSEPRS